MRLAEKTIELTFCAQLAAHWAMSVFWFGLTQKQEARAGFDAAVRTGGRLFIFQFKASAKVIIGGRRFQAPHSQMTNLIERCRSPRSVFYVLPDLGTTLDIANDIDLLDRTWLLDADDLRDVDPPVTPWNTPRKNGAHYFDLAAPLVHIHDPLYEKKVFAASALPRLEESGLTSALLGEIGFDDFWSTRARFTGTVAALVVPQQGAATQGHLAGSDTTQEKTESDSHHKRAAEEDERDRSSSVSLARFKHLIEDAPDEELES